MSGIKVMRHFFRRKARTKELSVIKALQNMLTPKQWLTLSENCPDRREIMEVAANMMAISVPELTAQVASSLSMPVAPHIAPMRPEILEGKTSFESLKRQGAILLTTASGVIGIACTDPAEARMLREQFSGLQVYLAPWSQIRAALDASEVDIQQNSRNSEISSEEKLERAAIAGFCKLLSQIEKHGAFSLRLRLDAGNLTYQFPTEEGKQGRGNVAPQVTNVLMNFLEKTASGATSSILSPPGTPSRSVLVQESGARLEYRVTWTTNHEAPFPGEASCHTFTAGGRSRAQHELAKIIPMPRPPFTSQARSADKELLPDNQSPEHLSPQARVLLVEDNPTFGLVLCKMFKRHNIEIVHLPDADTAFSKLNAKAVCPQLIICDFHMPGMNGIEFIKTLRTREEYKDIPLIMLTSDNENEPQIRALEEGADAFVGKQEEPKILLAHVRRLLQRSGGTVAA